MFGTNNLPVPIIPLIPVTQVNSYASDFFKFKSNKSVTSENHLSDNHAYRLLSRFNGFLKKVKTAISHGGTHAYIVCFNFE